MTRLSHVDDSAEGQRAVGASGHAVEFERPEDGRFVEAVEVFASRYGYPKAPRENFHVYILDDKRQALADVPVPYGTIERAQAKWYLLRTPSVEVTERFVVALDFNCGRTKGVRVGVDQSVEESHSLTGLPETGFEQVKEPWDWMVRAVVSGKPTGKKGIVRLADRKAAAAADPFAESIEVKLDTGESDGRRSMAGAGPAVRIPAKAIPVKPADKPLVYKLRGLRVYASRYGSGYDLDKTMVQITVTGFDGKPREPLQVPYRRFGYKPRWVALAFDEPIDLGEAPKRGSITIALDPRAARTKGIFFHYNGEPETSHSLIGAPGRFREAPELEWMIRAYLSAEPAAEF
jgi:hypothetical protein